MGVLGIDEKPEWHNCNPELVEKSKVKSLLHKAIDHGKSTGTYIIYSNTIVIFYYENDDIFY